MTSPVDLQRVKAYGRIYKSLRILRHIILADVLLIVNRGTDLAIIISQQPTELMVSVLPASE